MPLKAGVRLSHSKLINQNYQQERTFTVLSDGSIIEDLHFNLGNVSYSYDLNGNLINEIRSHGGLIQDKNFIRSYNELGRLVNMSLLNGTLVEEYI